MECPYCCSEERMEMIKDRAESGGSFGVIRLQEYIMNGSFCTDLTISGKEFIADEYKINYCPVCGRSLREAE